LLNAVLHSVTDLIILPLLLLLLLLPFSPISQSLSAPAPRYALPGRSVAAVTRHIVAEQWAFCLGILLSYLGQFLVLPAILGFVHWQAVGSWYPLLLQVGALSFLSFTRLLSATSGCFARGFS
jgi:hypothetical protein